MFNPIKKLWHYFCYFFQAKKFWAWPQHSKVLIYDAANSEILLEYLNPWNPEILHVRGEQINMPVFLESFFKKGRFRDSYIDCFIKKVRPHLIITIVDNNPLFYAISQRHPDVKTLFIQNGLRSYHCDVFKNLDMFNSDTKSTFFVDYMLTFGSTIGESYSRYIKGDNIPIGSIKNNFMPKESSPQSGTILFVSVWKKSKGRWFGDTFSSFEDFWTRPDKLVIQCLMKYAKEKNKRLVIALRCQHDNDLLSQEKNYFKGIMGVEPEFLQTSGLYTIYPIIDSAEVVVSLSSTLRYESIARCKKTAVFSVRGTLQGISDWNYGWPADFSDEGLFWTNKPDPEIFVRILDYLFEVSDEQWKEDVESTNFSSIMKYDHGNTILQSILEKELGPPPKSLN
jgi:surface carbohydrate biosynthesis protein